MPTTTSSTPAQPAHDLGHYLERLAQLQFYVIEMTPSDKWDVDAPEFAELLRDHLAWLDQQQEDGTLFLAGPLDIEQGLGPGMAVLRAESIEAAAALAADEPFARAGRRDNRVRTWQVNEGRIDLTVDLLGGRGTLR